MKFPFEPFFRDFINYHLKYFNKIDFFCCCQLNFLTLRKHKLYLLKCPPKGTACIFCLYFFHSTYWRNLFMKFNNKVKWNKYKGKYSLIINLKSILNEWMNDGKLITNFFSYYYHHYYYYCYYHEIFITKKFLFSLIARGNGNWILFRYFWILIAIKNILRVGF